MERSLYVDRRSFLRGVGGMVAGAALGAVMAPAVPLIDQGAEQGLQQVQPEWVAPADRNPCAPPRDAQACPTFDERSNASKVDTLVVAPFMEELLLRRLPSYLCGPSEVHQPYRSWGLTLREVGLGLLSAAAQALVHGRRRGNYEPRNASPGAALEGAGYWYLQRKMGFVANLTAHMARNAGAVALTDLAAKPDRRVQW
jgi:hypothetical protein